MKKDKLLKTAPPRAATRHAGGFYRIKSQYAELPLNSIFYTVPPALAGATDGSQLLLFQSDNRFIVGRWLPNVDGCDWILQPNRLIRVTSPIRIIGAVMPCPDPPPARRSADDDQQRNHLRFNPGGFHAC